MPTSPQEDRVEGGDWPVVSLTADEAGRPDGASSSAAQIYYPASAPNVLSPEEADGVLDYIDVEPQDTPADRCQGCGSPLHGDHDNACPTGKWKVEAPDCQPEQDTPAPRFKEGQQFKGHALGQPVTITLRSGALIDPEDGQPPFWVWTIVTQLGGGGSVSEKVLATEYELVQPQPVGSGGEDGGEGGWPAEVEMVIDVCDDPPRPFLASVLDNGDGENDWRQNVEYLTQMYVRRDSRLTKEQVRELVEEQIRHCKERMGNYPAGSGGAVGAAHRCRGFEHLLTVLAAFGEEHPRAN
jgi:hypothetical protein